MGKALEECQGDRGGQRDQKSPSDATASEQGYPDFHLRNNQQTQTHRNAGDHRNEHQKKAERARSREFRTQPCAGVHRKHIESLPFFLAPAANLGPPLPPQQNPALAWPQQPARPIHPSVSPQKGIRPSRLQKTSRG